MGFLGDLGKALMGQPVGQQPSATAQQPETMAQKNGLVDEDGRKIIPDIDLKNVQSHRQANKLTVTAWVMNNSDQILRVDSCYLLKQNRTLNQVMSPRQSRQLTLYDGPIPRDENEHQARIVYRLQANGDTFQNYYRIGYHPEADGARMIDDLYDDGPVQDI